MIAIVSSSDNSSFNLSVEEYLFSEYNEEVLYLYVNTSSVIVGSNQEVKQEVNVDYCEKNDIQIIRRMSGGGAVYHDKGNLNYSFIWNKGRGGSPLNADFLLPVIKVLNTLQVPVELGKRKDLWLKSGHKISGTASHISRNRELHHGTLLYNTDLWKLQQSLETGVSIENNEVIKKKRTASIKSPVTNIRTFLLENEILAPNTDCFFQLFIERLMNYFHIDKLSQLSEHDMEQIDKLRKRKYNQPVWNYKL
ncbi:MAG: lipoate--protein ligase family protein [Dysgonamonadaceae bacterium]